MLCETTMEIHSYVQMKTSRGKAVPRQTMTWPGHQQINKSFGQLAFFYCESFLHQDGFCLHNGNKTSFWGRNGNP